MAEKAACRAQFSLSEVCAGCSKSLCVTTRANWARCRFSSDSTGTAATGKGFTGRRRAIELVAEHGLPAAHPCESATQHCVADLAFSIAVQRAGIHLFRGRAVRRRNHVRAYHRRAVLLWKRSHRVALGARVSAPAEREIKFEDAGQRSNRAGEMPPSRQRFGAPLRIVRARLRDIPALWRRAIREERP